MGDFIKTNEQYGTGFEVNEYNGKISLISAREAQNGQVYQKWGDIEIGKDKKKRLPVAVELGTPEDAIQLLESAIFIIRKEYVDKDSGPAFSDTEDDDVPF